MLNKMIMPIALVAAISQWAFGQCECPGGQEDLVLSYRFAQGPKLIVCGDPNGDGSCFGITVINCQNNRALLSMTPDQVPLLLNSFRPFVKEGTVFIDQFIRLPSEPGWRWASHSFYEKKISCKDGTLTISEWQNIFTVPKKTNEEIDAFLDIYENHFEQEDPLNLPAKLMLCALNGSQKAEQLLMSYPQDHEKIFDGANAENYSDILGFYKEILKK